MKQKKTDIMKKTAVAALIAIRGGTGQRCAWTGFWIFRVLTPAASCRIRIQVFLKFLITKG